MSRHKKFSSFVLVISIFLAIIFVVSFSFYIFYGLKSGKPGEITINSKHGSSSSSAAVLSSYTDNPTLTYPNSISQTGSSVYLPTYPTQSTTIDENSTTTSGGSSTGSNDNTTIKKDTEPTVNTNPVPVASSSNTDSVDTGNTSTETSTFTNNSSVNTKILPTVPAGYPATQQEILNTKIMSRETKQIVAIEKIENVEVGSNGSVVMVSGIKFQGRALPNATVLLYIFSDPIIVSVKADGNGDWQYVLDQPLDNGKHETYIVMQDDQTKEVLRTETKSFFVGTAIAKSNLLDIPEGKSLILEDPFVVIFKEYILYAAGAILVALIMIIIVASRKKRNAASK